LAAKVPGWNRYWLAADKLAAMQKEVAPTEATQKSRSVGSATLSTISQVAKAGWKIAMPGSTIRFATPAAPVCKLAERNP